MIARCSNLVLIGVVGTLGIAFAGQVLAQTPAIPESEGVSHLRAMPERRDRSRREKRLEEMAAAVRRNPDDAKQLASYGLALVHAGRHDEGLNALIRASSKAGLEPEVNLLYAKALIRTGSPEQAIEKALEVTQSPLATQDEIGEAYSVAGFARWRQGSISGAETYLRQAIKYTPKNAGALLNLGLVLYGSDRRSAGIASMEKAALLAPDDARIQRIMADLYDNMGQSEKSLAAWEKVAVARPDDVQVRLKIATGWLAQEQAAKAIPHLVVAVEESHKQKNKRQAHVLLANAFAQTERYEEAREQAKEAQRLGADMSDLLQLIEAK